MRKLQQFVRTRLKERPDSELQQATIRFIIVVIAYLYFSSPWFSHSTQLVTTLNTIIVPMLAFASVLVFLPAIDLRASVIRRVCGMVFDFSLISYILILAGNTGIPVVGLYLWVTLGNGFRYGMRYLIACVMATVVGFTLVFIFSEFWNADPHLWWGLLATLIAIPAYAATLLRDYQDAVRNADESNNAKSIFLANMTYQLRTPINGIVGISNLLRETELKNNQLNLVRMVHKAATNLNEIIESILDISKIESGRVQIVNESFDLYKTARSVMSAVEGSARRKGLRLNLVIDPHVPFNFNGDRRHLRQVLLTLITDSISFTESGRIDLIIRKSSASSIPAIRFEIADTGSGIPLYAQKGIFHSFTQPQNNSSTRFGRASLSITIVKNLVSMMGGSMHLESMLGKGTRFWFDLESLSIEDGPPPKFANLVRVGVLVAQDDMPRVTKLVRQIGGEAVPLFSVENLRKDFLIREYIDVVLLDDTALPNDPIAFIQSISGNSRNQLPPLILNQNAASATDDAALVHAGYASVLHGAITGRLLFNSVHSTVDGTLADKEQPLSVRYQEKSQGFGPARILLAENDPVDRKLIVELLQSMGHTVIIARDSDETLSKLGSERPDIALIDWGMPEISSHKVINQWRFMENGHLPVVALQSGSQRNQESACMDAGFDAVLTKPVAGVELCDQIAELLNRSKSMQADGPSSVMPQLSQGPIIDEDVLTGIVQIGGIALVHEILEFFGKDSSECLRKTRGALFARDHVQWHTQLHNLKDGAMDLGARKVVQLCDRALKPEYLNSRRIDALNLLDDIKAALGEAQLAIGSYLKQQRSSPDGVENIGGQS